MELFLKYLSVFAVGGLICVPAQILICKTKLTPARILVIYVVSGVVLGGLGVYKPLKELFGCGASVPLTGFGAALAEGVTDAVNEKGLSGAFTGGMTAMAAGITVAMICALLCSVFFRSKSKAAD